MLRLAGCIIKDNEGKIFLLHRNIPGRVQWETPGGKIEDGEEAEYAAIREVKEELGVDVEIIGKLGEHEFIEDGHAMHYIWYSVKIISGIPTIQESKFDDLRAFSWDEMQKIYTELSPNTKNLVTAYQTNSLTINHN